MTLDDRKPVLADLAQRLAAAWRVSGVIETVRSDDIPRNRPEAYFVQDRIAALLDLSITGWKIGATSAIMREREGHDDILPGRLFAPITHFATQHTLALGDCPNPRVETEFAVRLTAGLPLRDAPWTAEEVGHVMALHPGLEIIGNRFTPGDIPAASKSLMGIADNGGCVAGVFGEAVEDWDEIDFATHSISFVVDGGEPSENFVGDMRCDPRQAVAELANLLAGRGLSLARGDMLLTGAATVPLPVQKGSHLTADFGTLGRLEMDFT